jgi:hypothetical protein
VRSTSDRYHVTIKCKFIPPSVIVFLSGDRMTFLWWGHKVDLWCAELSVLGPFDTGTFV